MADFPTFLFSVAREPQQLLERRNNFDGEFIDSPFCEANINSCIPAARTTFR